MAILRAATKVLSVFFSPLTSGERKFLWMVKFATSTGKFRVVWMVWLRIVVFDNGALNLRDGSSWHQ